MPRAGVGILDRGPMLTDRSRQGDGNQWHEVATRCSGRDDQLTSAVRAERSDGATAPVRWMIGLVTHEKPPALDSAQQSSGTRC